jgi:hypothetical protein
MFYLPLNGDEAGTIPAYAGTVITRHSYKPLSR